MKENNVVKIHLFNVGEGDSLLLSFPTKKGTKWGMIDCFYPFSLNEPPVLKAIRENGISELEFICLTHPDYDHYRGLSQIIDYFSINGRKINGFWIFGAVNVLKVYAYFRRKYEELPTNDDVKSRERLKVSKAQKKYYKERVVEFRKIIEFLSENLKTEHFYPLKLRGVSPLADFEPVEIHCLAPVSKVEIEYEEHLGILFKNPFASRKEAGEHPNVISAILMLEFGDSRILFGGDASKGEWWKALEESKRLNKFGHKEVKANFVKVSHHGSKHSSDPELWRELLRRDACVAISAGNHGNRYNHPDHETLEDLRKIHCEMFAIRLYCTNVSPTCREKFADRLREEETSVFEQLPPDVRHAYDYNIFRSRPVKYLLDGFPVCFGTCVFEVDDKCSARLIENNGPRESCWFLEDLNQRTLTS